MHILMRCLCSFIYRQKKYYGRMGNLSRLRFTITLASLTILYFFSNFNPFLDYVLRLCDDS
jgi:hypothetical protein